MHEMLCGQDNKIGLQVNNSMTLNLATVLKLHSEKYLVTSTNQLIGYFNYARVWNVCKLVYFHIVALCEFQ